MVKQTVIVEKTGISAAAVSMILRGKRKIGWDVAKRLEAVSRRKAAWWMEAAPEQVTSELNRIAA